MDVKNYKERPIMFSGPMVRALLDGAKTQTRREFKVRGWQAAALRSLEFVHVLHGAAARVLSCAQPVDTAWAGFKLSADSISPAYFKCPYGQPGERLWVRETFFAYGRWETRYSEKKQRDEWHFIDMTLECDRAYQYAADNPDVPLAKGRGATPGWYRRPAIFMPRAASRILPEIVSVRVERLNDISEADCWAEGIDACDGLLNDMQIFEAAKRMGRTFEDAAPTYAALWESINGAGSWDTNPWVWVVEFNRVAP